MPSRPNKPNREFLRSLLVPLVQQWGAIEVEEVLRELVLSPSVSREEKGSSRKGAGEGIRESTHSDRRPTAVSIVERRAGSDSRKPAFLSLAEQYDQKAFLPSLNDVKHFLEMRGHDHYGFKHRSDAFRRVLKVLLDMDDASLLKLIESEAYTGPSQLGPLSSAIRSSSASLRPHGHTIPEDNSQGAPLESDAESHEKAAGRDDPADS